MAQLYRQALSHALNKEIDWDSDAITLTLHTVSYTPNLDTHAFVSDLSAELAAGSGYSTGGITLTSCTRTYTAANSWATTAATTTAYALGAVVKPSGGNTFLYRAAVAGTSGGSAPTWPTVVGTTVADGTVTWECVGSGVLQLTAANAVFSSPFSAGPFRYAVISDRTAGTAATQPLVALVDFGSNQTGGGGALNVNWNTLGVVDLFLP